MSQTSRGFAVPSHLPYLTSLSCETLHPIDAPALNSRATITLQMILPAWSIAYRGLPTSTIDTIGLDQGAREIIDKAAYFQSDSLSIKTTKTEYKILAYPDETAILRWRDINSGSGWNYAPWPFDLDSESSRYARIYFDCGENKLMFSLEHGPYEKNTDHLLFHYSKDDDDHTSRVRDELLEPLVEDCEKIRHAFNGAPPLAQGDNAIISALNGEAVFPFYLETEDDSQYYHPEDCNAFLRMIDLWVRVKRPEIGPLRIVSHGRYVNADGSVSPFDICIISPSPPDEEIAEALKILSAFMDMPDAPIPLHKQFGRHPGSDKPLFAGFTEHDPAPSSHEALAGYEKIQNILAATRP